MSIIVKAGQARNLTSHSTPEGRVLDSTLKRFLTFITPHGAVHTIIVDADHAAKTADELLGWFEHTKAGVELSSNRATSPYFKTAEQIIHDADVALGFVTGNPPAASPTDPTQGSGGVF